MTKNKKVSLQQRIERRKKNHAKKSIKEVILKIYIFIVFLTYTKN